MTSAATVIADSVSPDGSRLTTMEVRMHRFVLAEFNTHRVFSRNSASSRAIPLGKQIARLREDLAYPVVWPSEQPGMQGGDAIDDPFMAESIWEKAADAAINHALRLQELRVHKSVINRLLEPFMWHTVIVTSTEWENFFGLRCHELAQPEIRVAAELMRDEYQASTPDFLKYGEWHAPYASNSMRAGDLEGALKASVARCAWVSTVAHDGDHSWEAIERMYDRLTTAVPMHASPLEHQACPAAYEAPGNFNGWCQLRHMVENGQVPW
jgi:thymidylate synthase ThyX